MAGIKTISLECGYTGKSVLRNVDLDVRSGQLITVIGLNGSGKSTLLRTICGLQPALSGTVSIDDADLGDLTAQELSRKLSIVLTNPPTISNMKAWDMVAMGRYPYTGISGRLSEDDVTVVERAIDQLGIQELMTGELGELSDGERQKVMIARALAQDTEIIIMDEPTAHLDALNRVLTLKTLHDLAEQTGKTIIFTTHDLSLALQIADRMWMVHEGEVRADNIDELIKSEFFLSVYNTESVTFNSESYQLRIE